MKKRKKFEKATTPNKKYFIIITSYDTNVSYFYASYPTVVL